MDDIELRAYRHTIETVNSQLEKMGIERLYARTNAGFELKGHATLIALICTNMNQQSRYAIHLSGTRTGHRRERYASRYMHQ
jgi:hypothetical protein